MASLSTAAAMRAATTQQHKLAFGFGAALGTAFTASRPSRWTASVSQPSPQSTPAAANKPLSRPFKLAPSDFAFLWEECKRCFYLKAHGKLYRPRAPFPAIFGVIDTSMKHHFRGLRTTDMLPDMKPGVFLCEDDDAWVESMPITPPNHTASVFIRGMIDCMVRFEDGTFGIIDFKTSSAAKSSSLYARQLHAYAAALNNPAPGSELAQCTISDLGLVVYTPAKFQTPVTETNEVMAALTGQLTYVHMPYDDVAFSKFLSDVLDVLMLPEAPPPPPPPPASKRAFFHQFSSCPYCQYLHEARQRGFVP